MGFKVILSKELKRVFGDKKMVFSLFILCLLYTSDAADDQ